MYERIQDRLHGKKRQLINDYRNFNDDFPLKSILVDPEGNPLLTGRSKGRKNRYPYYRFNAVSKFHGKSIRAEKVHARFNDLLKEMKIDKAKKEIIGKRLIERLNNMEQAGLKHKESQKEEIEVLKKQEEELTNKILTFSNL